MSGKHACARTTTAVSCVIRAQACGELVAWVQPRDGALFPPDLDAAGVDLDSFIAIQVPRHAGPFALVRAAEWLARSGAFGLRQYDGRILLLTSSAYEDPSSGPLVGLRIEPRRGALHADRFEVHTRVLKDKIGIAIELSPWKPIAPAGLLGAS
ncbi:MAG: hypothetical protein JRE19_06060 [Deltaproteobacteria bacterium]|nr:hypothetical protein [Deltaproteobacteria bacterium]